jgi:hypothetical protein
MVRVEISNRFAIVANLNGQVGEPSSRMPGCLDSRDCARHPTAFGTEISERCAAIAAELLRGRTLL